VLFGGLVTIPFWGYLNSPIAYMNVMMADLPHIQYNYKKNVTKQQEDDAMLITRKMQQEVKSKGIQGIKLLDAGESSALFDKLKK
jgi:hypothetical protein